jgi:ketosteroid isomerase-like protein
MIHATADAAETEFYRAFAEGDLAGMIRVWAESDDVVCVHPGQESLSGRSSVADSWRDILGSAGGFEIVYQCVERHESGDLAMHTGVEQLRMDDERVATLTVTNGYRKTPDGWRMVLHHAAPVHATTVPDGPVH